MSSWLAVLRSKFGDMDAIALSRLDTMLNRFEQEMRDNRPPDMSEEGYDIKTRRAVRHVVHSLVPDSKGDGQQVKFYSRVHAHELDFSLGENVYSTNPRLLFKVPAAREDGASGPVPIAQVGNVTDFNTLGPEVTPKTALIVPNQLGEQENLSDRPVVQWSALQPGEYLNVSNITLEQRKSIHDMVAAVMNPPEGKDAFQYYDEAGTVEDLAKIVRGLQAMGIGNMYSTNDSFRRAAVRPLPAYEDQPVDKKALSGFYEKPSDIIMNSAVFIPGPIIFAGYGSAEENMPGSSFAILETDLKHSEYDVRPLAPSYVRKHFVYRQSRMSVDEEPSAGVAQVMFIPNHPLRDFVREFESFQRDLLDYNRGLALKPKRAFNKGVNAG